MKTMGGGITEWGTKALQLGLDNSTCFRWDANYEVPKDKFMVPYLHLAKKDNSEPEIIGVNYLLITREQASKIRQELERIPQDKLTEDALYKKFINEIYYGREGE